MTNLGVSYAPKIDDHMDKLLLRECPTCGARIGEFCMKKGGKPVLKVQDAHSARFGVKKKRPRAFYWTK